MNPSMRENATHRFEISTTYESGLQDELTILVVSANLESRRTVSNILEALCVSVIPCSTLAQTEQVLLLQRPSLIFCDERLPDGGYADLLELKLPGGITPPIVVLTRNGEWELYMDATRRGAFDVIRSPWCPTDIELSFIRAVREERHKISHAGDHGRCSIRKAKLDI
jgi:DNA-binding NtrC family response regulator